MEYNKLYNNEDNSAPGPWYRFWCTVYIYTRPPKFNLIAVVVYVIA